jgi:hypothetical protein
MPDSTNRDVTVSDGGGGGDDDVSSSVAFCGIIGYSDTWRQKFDEEATNSGANEASAATLKHTDCDDEENTDWNKVLNIWSEAMAALSTTPSQWRLLGQSVHGLRAWDERT